jgi:DNA-binding transcriptional LysR family regulator
MRLSIKSLRYFLVACEQESIAKAAKLLNVVPSAISVAIDQVEEEFDLKLVQRYPAKGIQPTSTGLKMMQKVRHLIEEYDNLLSEGDELRTALSGSLAIGYYAPIAPAFMPAIVEPIMQQNPDVKLAFTECDNERAQAGLLKGEFDCIVFVAENVRTGIDYETLLEAPPYLLVAADHPLAKEAAVSLKALRELPMVLLDLPFTSEYYRSLLEEHSVQANLVATASSTEMVRSLVGAGVGCSILNMLPAASLSYAGDDLCAVPFVEEAQSLRLVLGHLGGKQRRLLSVFSKACQEYFAREQAKQLVVK